MHSTTQSCNKYQFTNYKIQININFQSINDPILIDIIFEIVIWDLFDICDLLFVIFNCSLTFTPGVDGNFIYFARGVNQMIMRIQICDCTGMIGDY